MLLLSNSTNEDLSLIEFPVICDIKINYQNYWKKSYIIYRSEFLEVMLAK